MAMALSVHHENAFMGWFRKRGSFAVWNLKLGAIFRLEFDIFSTFDLQLK